MISLVPMVSLTSMEHTVPPRLTGSAWVQTDTHTSSVVLAVLQDVLRAITTSTVVHTHGLDSQWDQVTMAAKHLAEQ